MRTAIESEEHFGLVYTHNPLHLIMEKPEGSDGRQLSPTAVTDIVWPTLRSRNRGVSPREEDTQTVSSADMSVTGHRNDLVTRVVNIMFLQRLEW
jgi:hypothetical protein